MDTVSLNLHVDAECFALAESIYEELGFLSAEELIQDILNEVTRNLLLEREFTNPFSDFFEQDFGDDFDYDIPF